ncbi:unnamed protein product [Symbiodinium sp. CCMP2592]|nr:unnamed protein product [Symbiodinium sp. CCMP2592]
MARTWIKLWALSLLHCARSQTECMGECDAHGMVQLKLEPASRNATTAAANESTSPAPTSTTETPSPHRNASATPEHDMATAPPTKEPPALQVSISTFHWEPHWQCAEADSACTAAALRRFEELVEESGADIVGALELKGASTSLSGWSSSHEYEDDVSVMVAPGWQVLKEGGGNICCDGQRGLAVLLVKPPNPVSNCETLCVMAVHPGHQPIQSGQSIVESVCGDARVSCAIAVGDWNVDAAGVTGGSFDSWHRLVGGNPPSFVVPDTETCCHPSTCCKFDHAVTNIFGAEVVKFQVWGYQLTDEFSMREEHMPVSVHFTVEQLRQHWETVRKDKGREEAGLQSPAVPSWLHFGSVGGLQILGQTAAGTGQGFLNVLKKRPLAPGTFQCLG